MQDRLKKWWFAASTCLGGRVGQFAALRQVGHQDAQQRALRRSTSPRRPRDQETRSRHPRQPRQPPLSLEHDLMPIDFRWKTASRYSLNRALANAYDMQRVADLSATVCRVREDGAVRVAVIRSVAEILPHRGVSHSAGFSPAGFAFDRAHEAVDMITRTPAVHRGDCGALHRGGLKRLPAISGSPARASTASGSRSQPGPSSGMGGTQRLPRLIPRSRALHMMVTGETLQPEEALQAGILIACIQRRASGTRSGARAQACQVRPCGYIAFGQRGAGNEPRRRTGDRARASEPLLASRMAED